MILTNTATNCFDLCEQRYAWAFEYGLRPTEPNFKMDVGALFHLGVDILLEEGLTEEALERAKFDALDFSKIDESKHDALTMARFLLDRYWEHWKREGDPWVEVMSTEETVGFPIQEDLWVFGKVDGLVKDRDGKVWIIEHKTTYAVDQDYLQKTALDGQIGLYMLIVREVFGQTPAGVIYDVICRPRKYMRKDEKLHQYLKRCVEEYRVAPSSYIARQRAFRAEDRLDRIREETLVKAQKIRECKASNFWCRNRDVCFLRERGCPFTRLCIDGERPAVLALFVQGEPHPELDLENALVPDYVEAA